MEGGKKRPGYFSGQEKFRDGTEGQLREGEGEGFVQKISDSQP